MDLHDIARQAASTAGADFAFILSQAGILVTRDAPRDMPERGRQRILWACPAERNGEVVHVEMPREDLVPFGGAAPVDVFAMRVEDAAILVVVLPSWHNKSKVMLALTEGAAPLTEMIRKAKKARAQKGAGKKPADAKKERASVPFVPARRERTSAAAPEGKRERTSAAAAAVRRERTSAPPEPAPRHRATLTFEPLRRERTSAAPKAPAPKEAAVARKPARPRVPSEPEIIIGEAEVGRETMLAIEAYRPHVTSEPEIVVGEATVGRETLVAIEASLPLARPGSAPDAMRVQLDSISRESMMEVERLEAAQRGRPTVEEPLVTERRTLPWVDSPAALKRTVEASELARGAAPPEVNVSVAEIDPDLLEQALREGK